MAHLNELYTLRREHGEFDLLGSLQRVALCNILHLPDVLLDKLEAVLLGKSLPVTERIVNEL